MNTKQNVYNTGLLTVLSLLNFLIIIIYWNNLQQENRLLVYSYLYNDTSQNNVSKLKKLWCNLWIFIYFVFFYVCIYVWVTEHTSTCVEALGPLSQERHLSHTISLVRFRNRTVVIRPVCKVPLPTASSFCSLSHNRYPYTHVFYKLFIFYVFTLYFSLLISYFSKT